MSRKIKILIFASGALLVILIFVFAYRFFIQADSNVVTISGNIYKGLSDATSGPPASGVFVTLIDKDNNKFTGITNIYGNYSINVGLPKSCGLKVFLSGQNYNAKEAGKITFTDQTTNQLNPMNNTRNRQYNFPINQEVDLMWSIWFNSAWPSGYGGQYHFSKWDYHYLRNQTTLSQITNKQAPKTASFEIPFQSLPAMMVRQWGYADNVWVNLHVSPVTSDWKASGPTTVGKPIYTLNGKFTDINSQGVAKFTVDLSSLDQETRYQSWINGFQIATSFYIGDSTGKDLQTPFQTDFNPDWRIKRSEDYGGKPISIISYSNLEPYLSGFCDVVLDPGHGSADDRGFLGSKTEGGDNFDIAIRVKKILESRGVSVLMTKNDAVSNPTNESRVNFANSSNVSLFVSLHSNSDGGPGPIGIVYCSGIPGNNSTDYKDDSCAVGQLGQQSRQLAKNIVNNIVSTLGLNAGRFMGGELGVLKGLKMPGAVIEMFAHDVQSDVDKESGKEDQLANTIANGILASLGK